MRAIGPAIGPTLALALVARHRLRQRLPAPRPAEVPVQRLREARLESVSAARGAPGSAPAGGRSSARGSGAGAGADRPARAALCSGAPQARAGAAAAAGGVPAGGRGRGLGAGRRSLPSGRAPIGPGLDRRPHLDLVHERLPAGLVQARCGRQAAARPKRPRPEASVPAAAQAYDHTRRALTSAGRPRAQRRVRSQCRFVPPVIHFMPDSLRDSVPCFLKQECDRTLAHRRAPGCRWW